VASLLLVYPLSSVNSATHFFCKLFKSILDLSQFYDRAGWSISSDPTSPMVLLSPLASGTLPSNAGSEPLSALKPDNRIIPPRRSVPSPECPRRPHCSRPSLCEGVVFDLRRCVGTVHGFAGRPAGHLKGRGKKSPAGGGAGKRNEPPRALHWEEYRQCPQGPNLTYPHSELGSVTIIVRPRKRDRRGAAHRTGQTYERSIGSHLYRSVRNPRICDCRHSGRAGRPLVARGCKGTFRADTSQRIPSTGEHV